MPWTKQQAEAIYMSYKKRHETIPPHVMEEIKHYIKHPSNKGE